MRRIIQIQEPLRIRLVKCKAGIVQAASTIPNVSGLNPSVAVQLILDTRVKVMRVPKHQAPRIDVHRSPRDIVRIFSPWNEDPRVATVPVECRFTDRRVSFYTVHTLKPWSKPIRHALPVLHA